MRNANSTTPAVPSRLRARSVVAGLALAALGASAAYGITASGIDLTPQRDVDEAASGANLLFGDGSVRSISQSINTTVWSALSTRAGGETVAE
jgi:prepilin-type processing-associated H-X9-DG protein